MPRAFAKRRSTRAWIDPVSGWIVVGAASPSRAEELLEVLRDEVDGLSLELPELAQSPGAAMTSWLAGGNAPGAFEIDTDGELRGNDQSKPTVRYQRHRSEEHTYELKYLMSISYAVFILKKNKKQQTH